MRGAGNSQQIGAKGRPLVMLAAVLSIWIGSRVVIWESPFPIVEVLEENTAQLLASRTEEPISVEYPARANADGNIKTLPASEADWTELTPVLPAGQAELVPSTHERALPPERANDLSVAAGHQLVWMAAMAHLPVPQSIEHRIAAPAHPAKPSIAPAIGVDRVSLDTWAFWREGSNAALVSAGRVPTYGASQAGAVLNYRLAPETKQDPRAYARAYRALIDHGETELAAGVSARPIGELPLRVHAELRVTEFQSSTEIRPAVFVTTELPTLSLPIGLEGEAYGQAGYVAGEAATAFADGQVHVMRELQSFDLGSIKIGTAAWAGAQKGAERVDVGPSLRLDLTIAETPARVSVDYRERIAGDAEPPSGVAVTLSTRF